MSKPWEDAKQSVRDKIEELFAVCEERGVHDLRFEVNMNDLMPPHIEYNVKQYLMSKEGEENEQR